MINNIALLCLSAILGAAIAYAICRYSCNKRRKIESVRAGEWFSCNDDPWVDSACVVIDVKNGWVKYQYAASQFYGTFGSCNSLRVSTFVSIYTNIKKPEWVTK